MTGPSPTTAFSPAPVAPTTGDGWHRLAVGIADLVFETDRGGRLSRIEPDGALGHRQQAVQGLSAAQILLAPDQPVAAAMMQTRRPAPRQLVRCRDADGHTCRAMLSVTPFRDAAGVQQGNRGIMVLLPDAPAAQSASLTHARMLTQIGGCMRGALLPRRGIEPALRTLATTLGATFASLRNEPDFTESPEPNGAEAPLHHPNTILEQTGEAGQATPRITSESTRFRNEHAVLAEDPHGSLIIVRLRVRCAGTLELRLQRPERGVWDETVALVAFSALSVIATVLELDLVVTELLNDARFDVLTGALNERGFIEYVSRTLPRLDQRHLPATLMLVAVDGLGAFNEANGLDAGDLALRELIRILREIVRPADVLGRVGGDTVAIWLETADQFTVSERADQICRHGLPMMLDTAHRLNLSIGFSTRAPDSHEPLESMFERARLALRATKAAGGNRWKHGLEGH
ncbi:diguanylate cyclase [Ameyamaea chiangmaiensis NBRC 103196]|uniref:GGDEF domain-containing protein n=1 Tax=Ameyamaea chiangmaiensis TaxID=442969 RepID=A0A850P749_9PROT|nr:GGDEF domain-containing protein [Ameyamaea chiangmaiensis]MBS4074071.1 GGDEF domain-containing protein [Ameyamaea chiangmaiensis]NVN40445.1 GGDEF domain-containing protein [Ameyamaea chiangmaiensis]GBQ67355.1 diguanylate cyclase [Ameyamaea chiangmaiensis NBRC 103196]